MRDQAQRLRELARNNMNSKYITSKGDVYYRQPLNRNKKIIAVTSGKGGVGKTNFTVNLALSLIKYGKKVLIIDADIGLANVDIVLGITPNYTLRDVILGKKTLMEIVANGPNGLLIIPGGSGMQEILHLPLRQLDYLIRSFIQLEEMTDFILIDTGAGLSAQVLSFVLAAEEVIVVTTPEPTALTDAYATIKVVLNRNNATPIKLVVNRVSSLQEGEEVAQKLCLATQKFLNSSIETMGFIFDDDNVTKAVCEQVPFLINYPSSLATQCIHHIASKICSEKRYPYPSGGVKTFISRVMGFFSR